MKKTLFILSALSMLFVSCTTTPKDREDPSPAGKPVLEASVASIENDGVDAVTFVVKVDGIDVTENAVIYLKGESTAVFEGTTFTSTEAGEYTFFASYDDKNSEYIIITVIQPSRPGVGLPEAPQPASIDFHSRVMVMQFTGTGCGYCPAVAASLKDLAKSEYNDKMQVVSIHGYNSDDPMYSALCAELASSMSVAGYPTVIYNMRSSVNSGNYGTIASTKRKMEEIIKDQHKPVAVAAISASSVRTGVDLEVSISVKAGVTGNYRVGLFIVEDGVEAAQAGNSSSFSGYDLHIHNNAVRADYLEHDSNGDSYNGEDLGLIEEGKEKTILLTTMLDEKWRKTNFDNCRLIIYVTSPDSATAARFYVKNVIGCPLDGKVPYSYNK